MARPPEPRPIQDRGGLARGRAPGSGAQGAAHQHHHRILAQGDAVGFAI